MVFAVTDAGRSAFDASLVVAGAQRTVARDHLAVIVPLDNPSKVRSLADLARPGLKLEVVDPAVPDDWPRIPRIPRNGRLGRDKTSSRRTQDGGDRSLALCSWRQLPAAR